MIPGTIMRSHSKTSTPLEPDLRNCGTPTMPQFGQYFCSSNLSGKGGGAAEFRAAVIPIAAKTTAMRPTIVDGSIALKCSTPRKFGLIEFEQDEELRQFLGLLFPYLSDHFSQDRK